MHKQDITANVVIWCYTIRCTMAMRQSAQLHIQSVLYKLLRRYLEHWLKRTAEVRASWVHWHAAMRVASVGLPWDSCVSRRTAVMVCLMLVGRRVAQ